MSAEVDSVLLASGGMDSTTMAYWLQDKGVEFVPLFIDYGQHCMETESNTLLSVLPSEYRGRVETISIADIYRGTGSRLIKEADLWEESVAADDLYVPYRNLLILSVGAAFAQARGYRRLFAAFINSNHAKEIDCSSEFMQRLALVLSDYGSVALEMPFRDMSKVDVARIGLELGVPLGITYSCQAASEMPCGACPNCVDRLDALADLSTDVET